MIPAAWLLLTLALPAGASGSGAPLAPGDVAPGFTATRLDGGTLKLDSLLGHPALLNFWSPTCPPCALEMPELEKLFHRYGSRGLRMVGITEMEASRKAVRRFLDDANVTYPIVLDADGTIGARYRLEAHPTSILLDAAGVVRFVNPGFLRGEERDIEDAIRKVLGLGPEGDPDRRNP